MYAHSTIEQNIHKKRARAVWTLGTTSLKSSKTMRPAGLPPIEQSKKTLGLPPAAAAAKGRAHAALEGKVRVTAPREHARLLRVA